MGKTGTTSIQETAFHALDASAPVGYFPKTALHIGSHVELVPKHGSYDENALAAGFEKIRSDTRDFLISCELIGSDVQIIEAIQQKARKYFNGRLRAIITLRPPSEWYRSNFRQKVKTGRYLIGESFGGFVERVNYPGFKLVRTWQQHLGDDVRVLQYQRDNFLSKFFSVLGLRSQHFAALDRTANISLNEHQTQYLRMMDEKAGEAGRTAQNYRGSFNLESLITKNLDAHRLPPLEAGPQHALKCLDMEYERRLEEWRRCKLLLE